MDAPGTTTDPADGPREVPGTPQATEDDLLEEELLVEEVSIDGMCGVY